MAYHTLHGVVTGGSHHPISLLLRDELDTPHFRADDRRGLRRYALFGPRGTADITAAASQAQREKSSLRPERILFVSRGLSLLVRARWVKPLSGAAGTS
jgi:hypothetical protein